jgi:DnaJ-class molecular chaperone
MDPNQQGSSFRQQGSPFEFHFGTGNMEDLFGNFGFGFGQRPMQRNKTLSINVEISLEDILNGKDINAEIGIPGGKNKIINIAIPPGIENGQQIRYEGMGDNSIPSLRAGDLIVNVIVRPHPTFKREGTSLILEKEVAVYDAILGSFLEIKTLDNKTLSINIPPGTQPETVFSCKGEGLPHMRTRQRGNLLIKIKVNIPKNLSPKQLELIQEFKNHGI